MSRGRTTILTIRLTPAQHQTLLAWQRATTIPAGVARRGRILLLLADGASISAIAGVVGVSRRFVYKWVRRFLQEGLEGLADDRPAPAGGAGPARRLPSRTRERAIASRA